ncbi:hypothetical protein COBT_003481 [Conglomerata obtusa]
MKDLIELGNELLINETHKFVFTALLKSFNLSEFKKGLLHSDKEIKLFGLKNEDLGIITVYNDFELDLIVKRNDFISETNEMLLKRITGDENGEGIWTKLGNEHLFVIDALRISEEDVMFCVSRIYNLV